MSVINRLDVFLSGRTLVALHAIATVLIVVIGTLDYLTGYELSFSVFYLMPVALVAWYVGETAGGVMSVISMLVWLGVDLGSGHSYSHPLFPVWNAMVRLAFFLITARLLSRIRRELASESEAARVDALTGLLNSRAFFEMGERIAQLEARSGHPITIAFIDLDDFKLINDTAGHEEGDRVLRSIGISLREATRSTDLVARLGGDEFVVLLPSAGQGDPDAVLERIVESIDAIRWGDDHRVEASVGAATFDRDSLDIREALKEADAAMYEVKKRGKGALRRVRLER